MKIFNWLATLWRGNISFDTPMLFVLGFLSVFTIGGLSSIYLAAFPIDWQVHDTYFVVAHFHYVILGGAVFAIFSGLCYWWPKMFGRMLHEGSGSGTSGSCSSASTSRSSRSTCSASKGCRAGSTRTPTRAGRGYNLAFDHRLVGDGDGLALRLP